MSIQRIALFLIVALCLLSACNDPSVVGLDLVEEDQINIQFREDVPFTLTTGEAMPVETFTLGINAMNGYFCGELNDPIFGRSEASIYAELGLDLVLPDYSNPDLEIDSIILVLPYNTNNFYGDTTELITLEVFEITEKLANDEAVFSNQTKMIDPNPVASHEFLPMPNTNVEFLDYRTGSEVTLQSTHLRVPLNNEFGQRFLDQDTLIYQSDSAFVESFHGLHIRTTNVENTMMNFNLIGSTVNEPGAQGGVYIFYDTLNTEGLPREDFFPFTPIKQFRTAKFVNFQHDYSDAPVGANIGDQPDNEEVIYAQGMAGVNGKLEFPNLEDLQNIVVNQAILELTLIDESTDPSFPTPNQLILFYEDEEGKLDYVSDFTVAALAVADNLTSAFGGDLRPTAKDSTIQKYTIFMPNHFQEMVDNKVGGTVYIQVAPTPLRIFTDFFNPAATKANLAGNVTLGSQNHPLEDFRAKFTLTYTELPQ